ncbi:hypothetical protein PG993_011263 [Apiospora rasikravindrae]|uniref:Uncharacterized protein n=1 Tax=Apiospora rasikravindrae TaxID=990691 RepID=A0ABR1SDP9_9PEZI
MSSSAPYPMAESSSSPEQAASSSSVCEQDTETSTYAPVTTAGSSPVTGTYGSGATNTTPLVQAGGNYSTGVATHMPPVATAGATAMAGSVGALAVLVLGALAI